jgi:hypothetical protein
MTEPLLVAKSKTAELQLLPALANRHGLIAGATGTGKTVTLQTLAQGFSRIGVPVFMADVKGDLSGLSQPGALSPKLKERLELLKLKDFALAGCPVVFWDVFGERGHPARAVTGVGPLLLGRMLGLNDTQQGVLTLVFKIADDSGLLLLDMKDLRAMLQHVGENAKDFTTEYGNVSTASIGAIQRGLLELEHQGGEKLYGEPALNIDDLMQVDRGRGVINILAGEKLMGAPKLYATFLLWLLSELFEHLPEVGDADKPKLVFFFDEAHLLFNEAPKALLEKIEQVVRSIRSKGVGVYFVTQNPLDIPDSVLGSPATARSTRCALTPKDPGGRRRRRPCARAEIERRNRHHRARGRRGAGVLLDEGGRTRLRRRRRPHRTLSNTERDAAIKASSIYGHYEKAIDRESAYEKLKGRTVARQETASAGTGGSVPAGPEGGLMDTLGSVLMGKTGPRGGHRDGLIESMAKSTARTIGSQIGREVVRGVLGSILGGGKRRR